MAKKEQKLPVGVIAAVLILGSLAALFLLHNFSEVGFGQSWPVLLIALGLTLSFAGYPELGLAIGGAFLILLLANLEVIPAFSKSWPFILVWIVVLVVFGYLRGRAAKNKQA